ncbi:DUF1707 domain-containing protein [Micromonospora sp. NPDC006431]|uniref:DUF1707 SHOCT-like domain-containing protein n=1 Tax=Micromonospora sp. NPDC006431 TaxID=3364235 RepID=UPI0036C19293
MDGEREMRAADTDRQATAERLRAALEEGRLDLHEYDERLGRTYGAKTYAELAEIVADLPGPAPAQRSALAAAPPGPLPAGEGVAAVAGRPSGWLLGIWSPWLRVAAVLIPIWLIVSIGSGNFSGYWPAWVLGPWGALLLLRTVGVSDGGPHPTERRRQARRERRRGR